MARYRRRTRVAAPFEEAWAFHSRIDGLTGITPAWMRLRVEAVSRPEGATDDPEGLPAGTRIRMSARPFGVGPRARWTSVIREREADEGEAYFRDEMVGGPFRTWIHTHRFLADGDATVIDDRVEYALPGGPLGRAANPLAAVGLEPMFRYRHRRTRKLLERSPSRRRDRRGGGTGSDPDR